MVDTENCRPTIPEEEGNILSETRLKHQVIEIGGIKFLVYFNFRLLERRGKKILQTSEKREDIYGREKYIIDKEEEVFGVKEFIRPERITYNRSEYASKNISLCLDRNGERIISIEETYKLVLLYPETSLFIFWGDYYENEEDEDEAEYMEEVDDWEFFLSNIGESVYEVPCRFYDDLVPEWNYQQEAWKARALAIFLNSF